MKFDIEASKIVEQEYDDIKEAGTATAREMRTDDTGKKHGISCWEYLNDRINKLNKIPYLPDLIRKKAQLISLAPP